MFPHSNTAFSRSSSTTTTTTTPPPPPMIHDHLLSFSDSLWQINNTCNNNNNDSGTHRHSLSTLFAELLHSHHAPKSNGMQHNHNSESPLSSECNIIIEGMNRAYPYSPEEKKVRIQRYRTKRNQRNFKKKIKYACRKTLADNRPRIRGRFAKNEEIGKNPTAQWSHIGDGEEEDEENENWVSIFDSLVAANLVHESLDSSSFGSVSLIP